MSGFKNIEKARRVLDLPEMATRDEIRSAYRQLSLQFHPDRCRKLPPEECQARFREITRARDILLEYLDAYRFIFTEDEYNKHLGPESRELLSKFFLNWF